MPLSYCADLVHIHAVLVVIGLSNDVEADAYAKLSVKVWITDRSLRSSAEQSGSVGEYQPDALHHQQDNIGLVVQEPRANSQDQTRASSGPGASTHHLQQGTINLSSQTLKCHSLAVHALLFNVR